jgi:hypothetical protein
MMTKARSNLRTREESMPIGGMYKNDDAAMRSNFFFMTGGNFEVPFKAEGPSVVVHIPSPATNLLLGPLCLATRCLDNMCLECLCLTSL